VGTDAGYLMTSIPVGIKYVMCLCVVSFYERWKQAEAMHAEMLQFSLDDDQWEQDWAVILSIASQPGDESIAVSMLHSHYSYCNYCNYRCCRRQRLSDTADLSVCLFGCQLDNFISCERILLKFCVWVSRGLIAK